MMDELSEEIFDEDHHQIDVYHHFDREVVSLLGALTKWLEAPIEIQIITGTNTVPTKIVLTPGTPRHN